MMKTKILTAVIGSFAISAFAHAGATQDCILEGKVKNARASDSENVVRIDFKRPKPYSKGVNCRIDNRFTFKQPKGHKLESLPAGATVRYRFQRNEQGEQWTLVDTTQ